MKSWRDRFAEEGLAKLGQVRKGRGRKPSIPQSKIDEIIDLTQNYRPKGETHWSCRTMAAAAGVSKSTVQLVWHARGLKPHRVQTFKLSNASTGCLMPKSYPPYSQFIAGHTTSSLIPSTPLGGSTGSLKRGESAGAARSALRRDLLQAGFAKGKAHLRRGAPPASLASFDCILLGVHS